MKQQTIKNFNNLLFILFLILCSRTLSIKIESQSTLETESELETNTDTFLSEFNYVEECTTSLMEAMPPAFCWKKGADFGVIPTGCPHNYFRSLALCYEYCKPGYSHILGICYKDCDSGYTNHGLSCFKNLFRWYFKSAYIPSSLTNFSDKVPCKGAMYRSGALCYRNCNTIGMDNCGIGACIAEGESCGAKILEMVGSVLEGVATGISTVLSLGASTAAKSAAKVGIKAAVKGAAKGAIKTASRALKKILTGKFKNVIKKKALNKLKEKVKRQIKEFGKGLLENEINRTVNGVCSSVWSATIQKAANSPVVTELGSRVLDTIDVIGVGNIINECKNTRAQNGVLNCAKAVVDSAATFDPTGLLTIASAFMHPSCDVPVYAPPEEKEEEFADYEDDTSEEVVELDTEVKVMKTVPDNCMWLYTGTNFSGDKLEVCNDLWFLGDKFNDKIKSFIVGKNAKGAIFEDANYKGRFLDFNGGATVKDVSKFTFGDVTLDKLISSVKFTRYTPQEQKLIDSVPANCLWLFKGNNFTGEKYVVCNNVSLLPGSFNDHIDSFIAGKKCKGKLYEHEKYTGFSFGFNEGMIVRDISIFKLGNFNLKNNLSSISLG
jgi:hypothetical protein